MKNIHHDHKIQNTCGLLVVVFFFNGKLLIICTFDSSKFNLRKILSVDSHFTITPMYLPFAYIYQIKIITALSILSCPNPVIQLPLAHC